MSPCNNCLRITGIQFDRDLGISLEIGLRHPFANASARPDLHGFDVRLIFFLDENLVQTWSDINVCPPDGIEVPVKLPHGSVRNADGYTSHFDSIVTDDRYFHNGTDVPGNVNPFIRYFEDYSDSPFDPASPTGHNVMPTGSDWETQKALISSMGIMSGIPFYIVADVAYGQSAVFANRQSPQYYLPAFHRTEPWRMEYWIENNNLDETNPLSTVEVVVQVFDWQHGATVDPGYPDPGNLSGIPESSNVLQVELSVPAMQNDPVVATMPESGTGSPSDPLQYRLTLTNQNLLGYESIGFVAIRDELYGQTGRLPIPESPAGFPFPTEDILDYSLYNVIWINYPDPDLLDFNGEFQISEDELITTSGNIHLNHI